MATATLALPEQNTPVDIQVAGDDRVTDPHYKLRVYVGGREFTEDIELREGVNTITRTYKDDFGNETTVIHQVTLDSAAAKKKKPRLATLAPPPVAAATQAQPIQPQETVSSNKRIQVLAVDIQEKPERPGVPQALVSKETPSRPTAGSSVSRWANLKSSMRKVLMITYHGLKKQMKAKPSPAPAKVSLEAAAKKPAPETLGQKLKKMFVVIKAKMSDLVALGQGGGNTRSESLVSLEKGIAGGTGGPGSSAAPLEITSAALTDIFLGEAVPAGTGKALATLPAKELPKPARKRSAKPSSSSTLVSEEGSKAFASVTPSKLKFSKTSIRIPDEFGGITATTDNYQTGMRLIVRRDRNGNEISRQIVPNPDLKVTAPLKTPKEEPSPDSAP